ncbi:MAG: membrane associated rhomboid family serine protease, partial [Kiritimatiellia bacterium]
MLIVPIEKNLSLKHPPIVLFFIVLLNVCAFFFYQSGEDLTIQQSLDTYQKEHFFDEEWQYVQEYLTNTDKIVLLDEFDLLNSNKQYNELHFRILMHPDFFSYYKPFAISLSYDEGADQRIILREKIDQAIKSLSFIRFGLTPSDHSAITFITHQFLHGDLLHLLGNMFFLILFGFAVEAAIGHIRFLMFYVLSGITGGLLYMMVDIDSVMPLVGASGAISGVTAMYLAIFRLQKIEFFYWFFVFIGYIRAPALLILPLYIGKEIYYFYHDTGSNVAFMAHAGGLIGGSIFIGLSYIFTPNIFNREYIEEDQTQNPKQDE